MRFIHLFSKWLNWIAGVGLVSMMLLVCADIVGAKIFHLPVPGAVEIAGFLGVVIVAFAMAFTQVLKGHIQVEFLMMKLPPRVQAAFGSFTSLVGAVLFGLIVWKSCEFGYILQVTGEVSPTEEIPFYPFVYGIAFSSVPLCLLLVAESLKSLAKALKK